jgi:CDP-glucose 4,6-dehydratase
VQVLACWGGGYGYALEPPTDPSLFVLAEIEKTVKSVMCDVRDINDFKKRYGMHSPKSL